MNLIRRLLHRHTWRKLKVIYRYRDYQTGRKVTVYRCQCDICDKIQTIHFDGKTVVEGSVAI